MTSPRAMRVAFIRGSLLRSWELGNYALDAPGAQVTAFASRSVRLSGGPPPVEVRRLPSLNDLTRALGPRARGGVEHVLGTPEYLVGLERGLDGFDVAHSLELHNPLTAQAVKARDAGRCRRVVATVMENIPFRPPANGLVAGRMARVAGAVDHFLAVTERARLHLTTGGVPDERITTLPLGVDVQRFHPAPDRAPGAVPRPLRVVTVSRLEPAKGVEDLVVAVGLLAREGVEVDLTLVGEGPLAARLGVIAQAMGVAERVRLPGGVPYHELPALYRAHDVFVLASAPTRTWREQFGFAVVEAMASGLAVLAGDSGSLPEVVGGPDSLVRPHDPIGLAERLRELDADREAGRAQGRRNRQLAEERYDQVAVRRRLHAIYEQVLAEPSATRR